MALFFDSAWFDARLNAAGLSRDNVAAALGLTMEQVNELWKDQREFKPNDVRVLSLLLGATAEEVALRAGVSTPVPSDAPGSSAVLQELGERLTRVERSLAEIKALLLDLRTKP